MAYSWVSPSIHGGNHIHRMQLSSVIGLKMTLNIQRLLGHKGPAILEGRVNVHATERYESGLMVISPSLH